MPDHEEAVRARVLPSVARIRRQVVSRLSAEINYWDARHAELLDLESTGRTVRLRPETARRRARELERRLEKRLAELDADATLTSRPPIVCGVAVVIPQGLLDHLACRGSNPSAEHARETTRVERRAVEAVLAAERGLGRHPVEMARNHPGWDIRSVGDEGAVHIEVKGRVAGADDFTITHNEVLEAKNLEDSYRLALVSVGDEPNDDEVRYLTRPFDATSTDDFRVDKLVMKWRPMWNSGGPPR